jgi:hypothetical protein
MQVVRAVIAMALAAAMSAAPLHSPAAGPEIPEPARRQAVEPVEDKAITSETRQVFVKPDGTRVLHQNARPVRVRQADGWVPVDTTLRLQPDGSVAPVAAAVGLRFSGGGTGSLAGMSRGGKALELGWPGPLPKPALSGDTAIYSEVLPGVDLRVSADVDGFSHVVVVKTPAAARSLGKVSLPFKTTGLSMKRDEAGNLEAVDQAGGTIFTAPAPMMWDSTGAADTGTGSGGEAALTGQNGQTGATAVRDGAPAEARQAVMGVELAGKRLVLKPDAALIANPKTRYPLYLDPYFSAARGAWAPIYSNYPGNNYLNTSGVARVGHVSGQTNRSFFQMNTGAAIHGKQIIKATLRTYETWSYSCGKREVEAWDTGAISKSTTWNNQPRWIKKLATVNVAKGWGSACLPGGVEFDVTSMAVEASEEKWPTMTIGLRATSETDVYAWKKFKNNPSLVIEYNSYPDAPAAADAWSDPGGACATGTERPVVPTAAPRLWARLRDADNLVRARFEWWTADGGAKVGESVTPSLGTGSAFYAVVPQGAFGDGSVIRWRVRAEDGLADSAWSPWCEVAVDASAPGREPVVTSPQYPENIWSDGVGRAGAFTFEPNGVPDVVSYVYGLDTVPKAEVAADQNGSATIRLTPRHDGPNVLAVRSKDRAGQQGPVRTYVFNARAGTAPAGHWRLDEGQGQLAADTVNAHPATLYGPAGWATGKTGVGLRLDGTAAYAQTTGPAVSTGHNFTVAAWVRLTDTSHFATAVSQEGDRVSSFFLQYSKADDRWAMSRTSADSENEPGVRALSALAPRLNEWTHLAGVYDEAAGQVSLYVNGKLESTVPYPRPWEATGPLSIGRAKWSGAPADFWPGDIDDVRVYDRAMFGDEVAALVNSAATLVGHWKLDEESGTSAADSSGRATAATLGGGSSWTDGWLDGALALDGVNGYAQTGAPAVNTRTGFTVAAWTQLDYLPTADAAAVAQPGARAAGFQLGFDKEQGRWVLGMAATDTDSAALVRTRSDAVPAPLEWTHIAGVYDALAGELRIYVNGQLSTTTITGHVSAWNATGPLQLGRTKKAGAFTGYWPGTVDDVRLYDGVLTADQIVQLAAY